MEIMNNIHKKAGIGCIKTRSTLASFPPVTVKWAVSSPTLHCYSLTTPQWLIQKLLHTQPRRVRIPYMYTIHDSKRQLPPWKSKVIQDSIGFWIPRSGFRITWGAWVVQWWEHSSPTNVARVQILASTPCVGWVCSGSLLCSERFFSRYFGFPLSLKTNTSKFQSDLERTYTFQRVLMKCSVGKQITVLQFGLRIFVIGT